MTINEDKPKRWRPWQFGLRALLLATSLASFCFALIAQGHWATTVFLLAMPVWCWILIQGAVAVAATIHHRPRFTLRTLVILVTFVCCYAACWGPTKRRGVHDVERTERSVDELFFEASAKLPLIVGATVAKVGPAPSRRIKAFRRYHFWFFGYVAKLPFERELPWPAKAKTIPDAKRALSRDRSM